MVALGCLMQGCDKEEAYEPLDALAPEQKAAAADYAPKEYATVDSLIARYAMVVCHSMTNDAFRDILKEEVMQPFDDDYDVLATTLQKRLLDDKSQSVAELLATAYDHHYAHADGMKGHEFLHRVNSIVPNLQLSIPLHCEAWKPQQYIPAVVPLPYTFDDSRHDAITAYDANGVAHTVSLTKEPTMPYVVVGVSERITRNGLRRKELFKDSPLLYAFTPKQESSKEVSYPTWLSITNGEAYALNLHWEAVQEATAYVIFRKNSGQFRPHATVPGNQPYYIDAHLECDYYWYVVAAIRGNDTSACSPIEKCYAAARDNGAPLRLTGINYEDESLSNVEPWVRGAPEIHITVVGTGEDGFSAYTLFERVIEPPSRDAVDNNWWNPSLTLINNWNTTRHGERVNMAFTEDDNRRRNTFHLQGGNGGVQTDDGWAHYANYIAIRSDDMSGQTFFSFHSSHLDYTLGSFSFRCE